jgi:AAA+ ATPase superfamily predicted ATPase
LGRSQKKPNDILDLTESIAVSRKLKIIVCIDEFQSIGDLKKFIGISEKITVSLANAYAYYLLSIWK